MRTIAALIAIGLVLASGGCLERDITITSKPSGALVYVSDVEVGRTPVTVPFTWYGDYDIILRMEGYQTLKTHAQINPPLQEIPPVDLLAEMAPWTFRDRRYLHYALQESAAATDEELIERAARMRQENLQPADR